MRYDLTGIAREVRRAANGLSFNSNLLRDIQYLPKAGITAWEIQLVNKYIGHNYVRGSSEDVRAMLRLAHKIENSGGPKWKQYTKFSLDF